MKEEHLTAVMKSASASAGNRLRACPRNRRFRRCCVCRSSSFFFAHASACDARIAVEVLNVMAMFMTGIYAIVGCTSICGAGSTLSRLHVRARSSFAKPKNHTRVSLGQGSGSGSWFRTSRKPLLQGRRYITPNKIFLNTPPQKPYPSVAAGLGD